MTVWIWGVCRFGPSHWASVSSGGGGEGQDPQIVAEPLPPLPGATFTIVMSDKSLHNCESLLFLIGGKKITE